ncbi:MAG: hypothetical protein QS721_02255 [Candidatus Endonucleobacter sp. (ex Gigantidas childressi)]|nr:hypothetical protein [Candidatus Endonucleobacter sp. (ex Gigantidas childressi)]
MTENFGVRAVNLLACSLDHVKSGGFCIEHAIFSLAGCVCLRFYINGMDTYGRELFM